MQTKPDQDGQEPAFPFKEHSGITTRDYFAAKALTGILADPNVNEPSGSHARFAENIAVTAYSFADAMLKARAR